MPQVFFIFQGWMYLVFQKEEPWGAEVYTPFLQPVGVLAGLYYCTTLVLKIIFLYIIQYNKLVTISNTI